MERTLVCELHTHTLYSRDSLTSLEAFLEACRRKGLDRVAVTDHNAVDGALRLREMDPQRVIVGEEIKTTHGELIAYFIEERVPPGLPPAEVVERVHAQGGVVGASHPLDRVRREAIGLAALTPVLDHLDFLETFNARCLFPGDNDAARDLAQRHDLPMTAGSDAHHVWELGRAVVVVPPFDTPVEFLAGLRAGHIRARLSPPWIHAVSTYAKLARRFGLAPRAPEA
ncbi:MAG: PHP domain-containing protein [Anaerolineae bacterium]|nr:PHP domain-containing protein [Anaerolineae bacterium]